jgi:hypothetical protein
MNERTHDKMNLLGMVLVVALIATQNCIAGMYITVPKGAIYQAYVDYNDVNTVTITAGYGECSGNYWEITSSMDHDMLSLATGEDFHYIYIDDANSVYPDPCIIDSTTEPSWSDSKLGFYNGDDRCIGVIWSPDGSATITQFGSTHNLKYMPSVIGTNIKVVLTNGNPDSTFQFLEATAYTPVNAVAVAVIASNYSSGGNLCVVEVASNDYGNSRIIEDATSYASVCGWIDLPRGCSRDLQWYGEDNDNNSFTVGIRGFQIER